MIIRHHTGRYIVTFIAWFYLLEASARWCEPVLLVPLKQQVMINAVWHRSCTHASRLVGVETPAIPLVFRNCFAYIPMVFHFDTLVFFHLTSYFSLFSRLYWNIPGHASALHPQEKATDNHTKRQFVQWGNNPSNCYLCAVPCFQLASSLATVILLAVRRR